MWINLLKMLIKAVKNDVILWQEVCRACCGGAIRLITGSTATKRTSDTRETACRGKFGSRCSALYVRLV